MSTVTGSAGAGRRWAPRRWPDALRLGWADVLGPIGVASVVVVICMWLRTGGLQTAVAGVDEALGSLGLVTGLVSADLMILQVVMLARIPWVERAWGHDPQVSLSGDGKQDTRPAAAQSGGAESEHTDKPGESK